MSQLRPTPAPTPEHGRLALGASPRHLLGILSTWIVALLPANLVPSIIALGVNELGVPLAVAGMVATAMTLANAAGVLGMRSVVSRGHRVSVARVGVIVLVAPLLVAAVWTTGPVVMSAFVVAGLGSGALIAAATAAVAGTENPDRVTTAAMTVNRVIVALSFLVLPLLGGGIRGILFVLIGFGAVAFLGSMWLSRHDSVRTVSTRPESVVTAALDVPDSRALAWALAIAFAVWTVSEEGIYAVLSVIMTINLPTLDQNTTYVFLASGVFVGILGALASGLLRRMLGRAGALALVLGLSIAAKLGMLLLATEALYLVALIAWGFAFGASIPLVFGMAAKLSVSGSANVLVNGVYIVGVALGPLTATQLAELRGMPLLATVIISIAVVSAAAIVVIASRARSAIASADITREETPVL